jgi:DNA-binding MarR family transcriptional regulator
MATSEACTVLADAFAGLTRTRRTLLGPARDVSSVALLAGVERLGRPRTSDLAEHLGLDVSTVSRHVAGLRRQGLLVAEASRTDARSQPLHLTAEGRRELTRRRRDLADRLAGQLRTWDDTTVTRLASLLHEFVDTTAPVGNHPTGHHPTARRN